MKAIQIHQHGGPDVLSYDDVIIRTPGPGEVLVSNRAIGVNFVDTYLRTGAFPGPDLPFTPGKAPVRSLRSARTSPTSLRGIGSPMSRHSGVMPSNVSCTEAADRRYWLAFAHVSFPGIGHVRRAAKGYDRVPTTYGVDA